AAPFWKWLRRGAYVTAMAATLTLLWAQRDIKQHDSVALPSGGMPDVKPAVDGSGASVPTEPSGAQAPPSADRTAGDPRPAGLPGPDATPASPPAPTTPAIPGSAGKPPA
ncbi:MAG: hypothetical protein ABIS29_16105, partial [Vicinamibacterales bacterium]